MSNTRTYLNRESLAGIYNLFDLYVQLAICGGFEIPILEAASCGLKTFVSDYSPMSDVLRKVGGTPIKISRMFCEAETGCYRAYFDEEDFVQKVIDFLSLPKSIRDKKGRDARKRVEQGHFDWDKSAQQWMKYFDSVVPKDTWNSPPNLFRPQAVPPESNQWNQSQFTDWCILNIMGCPEVLNSYNAARWKKTLNWGQNQASFGGTDIQSDFSTIGLKPTWTPFNRDTLVQELTAIRQNINTWEQIRWERRS